MEYCHFTWKECWELPREYRKWFLDRKNKENEKIKEAQAKNKRNAPAPPAPKPPPRRR
jgi:hypothetical protein